MRNLVTTVPILLSIVAGGCAPPESEPPLPPDSDQPTTSQVADLRVLVRGYEHALVDSDRAALAGIVSREVVAHTLARGMDLGSFLDKQRSALQRTFALGDGQYPSLEVAEVTREGESLRAVLRRAGTLLPKPFYFVAEDGGYRLNLARPGFSTTPPDGALFGSDNYQVHNKNWGGDPVGIMCAGGQSVGLKAGETKSIRCTNTCGWFSGSTFARSPNANNVLKKCDWNWFGDDVIVSFWEFDGWTCADFC